MATSSAVAECSARTRKYADSCMLSSVMVRTLNDIKIAYTTQYDTILHRISIWCRATQTIWTQHADIFKCCQHVFDMSSTLPAKIVTTNKNTSKTCLQRHVFKDQFLVALPLQGLGGMFGGQEGGAEGGVNCWVLGWLVTVVLLAVCRVACPI